MSDLKINKHLDFNLKQIFGCNQQYQNIEKQDIITSLEFDPTGNFLAAGDHAGRIIIFKETQNQMNGTDKFQYHSEFQSHIPQFDSLESHTISQSIRNIKWLKPQGKYNKMLTVNANRIKLWKIFQKQKRCLILTSQTENNFQDGLIDELAIPQLRRQKVHTSSAQLIFPIKHSGIVNNLEATRNQQYIFSTDEQKALLWSLQNCEYPFVVEDKNKKLNWKDGQNISCSKFHPISDNIFLCGTSKGTVEMSDLRILFNNRKNTSFTYNSVEKPNYFTQITNKVNSLDFLQDGKYVISRDYLTIKIWDICKPNEPLKVIHTNQSIKERLCHLFENDCLEDQFQTSSVDSLIINGGYDNRFNIIDPFSGQNVQYQMDFDKKHTKTPIHLQKKTFAHNFDINRKIIRNCVHRKSRKIALASLNSFFIYAPS